VGYASANGTKVNGWMPSRPTSPRCLGSQCIATKAPTTPPIEIAASDPTYTQSPPN